MTSFHIKPTSVRTEFSNRLFLYIALKLFSKLAFFLKLIAGVYHTVRFKFDQDQTSFSVILNAYLVEFNYIDDVFILLLIDVMNKKQLYIMVCKCIYDILNWVIETSFTVLTRNLCF